MTSLWNDTTGMVNITVDGHAKQFKCPVGWTVEKAEERIRKAYLLSGGCIERNDLATDPTDQIQEGVDIVYEFVGGEKQQSIPQPTGK